MLAGVLVVASVAVTVGLALPEDRPDRPAAVASSVPPASTPVSTSASAPASTEPAPPPADVPTKGPNTFEYAPAAGQVIGTGGSPVKKYRVNVESRSGTTPAAFADVVRQVLADPRGWTAGGDLRFQQVAKDTSADFTITLATQASVEKICAAGGIHTEQFSSCRLPGHLMINLTRWLTAVPGYGAPLAEYQAFEINYAVGKELGSGNEACPAPGQPAPVMQKQTLGLKGCTANGWPYRDGKRYIGPQVP
jgi:hypothetical protein